MHNIRDGQGQDDGQQQAEVGAAVHLGGLLQLQRDAGLEVSTHDDDVVHADSGGDQDGPDGVAHPQAVYHQVGGDQAAAEEHGKGEHDGEEGLAFEIPLGQGVGAADVHDHVQGGAHHSVEDGVDKAGNEVLVLKHQLVAFEVELLGPEQEGVLVDLQGVRKGSHQYEPDRVNDNGHDKGQYHQRHSPEDFIAERELDVIALFPHLIKPPNDYHKDVSLTRFAMLFATTRTAKFITLLNRPTMVEKLYWACCKPALYT